MHFVPAVRSEWVKFRTVRSTLYALATTIALCVGFGAIVSFAQRQHWTQETGVEHLAFDATATSLSGFFFAEIAIGVIGVLIVSSEYSSGLIRATLSATPRRLWVLVAKAVVLFAVSIVVGELCSFVSFFVGQSIMRGVTPTATLSTPGALRAVVLAGVALALLAQFALGIGTMLRHTAGAITVYVSVLLVLLLIAFALPSSWSHHVYRWLPQVLAEEMQSTNTTSATTQFGNVFSPIVSMVVLACYAMASLVGGAVSLVRRDA